MFSSRNSHSTAAYQRISVETSMHTIDKHQVVSLLFDGLMESLGTARGALARKDVVAKCTAVSKALRILQEGLITGLDKVDGGTLADNLDALYGYCLNRLILANARNDDAMFQEVQHLLEPIAQAWKDMLHASVEPPAVTQPDPHVDRPKPVNHRMNAYTSLSLMGA